MFLKIISLIILTITLTFAGVYIMNFFVQRNIALLREYNLEPGRVCHHLTLAAGTACTLLLGAVFPETLVGKILSSFFLYWLWLLWLVDWRYQFIFDDMLLPLLLGAVLHLFFVPEKLWENILAMAAVFIILAALAILGRGALGGGDVKMMSVIALWLGPSSVLLSTLIGFMLGGVAALVLLILHRAGRKDFFAFGPFLIIGTLIGWLVQALTW